MTADPQWDNHLADALAMVNGVRERDTEGLRALLDNCDGAMTALRLAELFAVVMDEHGVPPESFRKWAYRAVSQ